MLKYSNGAVVQLVRIHACHAWGHGFESRTHRIRESDHHGRSFLLPHGMVFITKSCNFAIATPHYAAMSQRLTN